MPNVVGASDWPYWRGPQMDGISTEKDLPDDINPAGGEGSNLLWKQDTGSRATPVVLDGKLYMIGNDKPNTPEEEGEKVVCLDATTGSTLWEYRWNVYLSDVPHERIGWASVVAAPGYSPVYSEEDPKRVIGQRRDPSKDRIFAQGVSGYFCCLNAQTGAVEWDKSLHEEYGFLSTYGGRTNFPIVHENNVIVSAVVIGWGEMAKPTHRFIAFDIRNGEPVWFSGTRVFPEDTTYSAPVLCTLGGKAAIVFGSGDGALHAMEPRTGRIIWSYYCSKHGLNCTPLVANDTVYLGHSEENLGSNTMGALICLDGKQTGDISSQPPKWKIDELAVGRSSPLLLDNRLYVVDDQAKMFILNPETGEQIGKLALGTMMRASPLYADGKIYIGEVNGRWYILEPAEKGVKILKKGRFAAGEECHGSCVAANGRVYFPTTDAMYCFGKADVKPDAAAESLPDVLAGESPKTDTTPAVVQVTPVESLLVTDSSKGDAQSFDIRLYNAAGQFLRMAKAEEVQLTIEGPGQIAIKDYEDKNKDKASRWTYTVGPEQTKQAGVIVKAKLGDVEGTARIRVVPDLNWSYNFDDGVVPITWVGVRYRHVVIDFDLYQKLKTADPLAGLLYVYLSAGFTNTGAPKQTFDNSTSALRWNALLDYLQREKSDVARTSPEEARKLLDPWLELLKTEKVIESYTWSTWEEAGSTTPSPRLLVAKGPRKVEGNGVLYKVRTIPKGGRSQGWMGPIGFKNYTIQADVCSVSRGNRMPDIGLTAQRYILILSGAGQELRFRTWITQPERFSVNLPFAWQPEKWYTLKFQASVEGDKAVVRGKCWPKGESEPADWTVVGEDHSPNVTGSPGLFGDAKEAEFMYDNLTVTRNDSPPSPPAAAAK
ncbi:MAG: PQQ-binding-like beta-propeller repeat protein [Planctomycetaceae bacterium]